MSVSSREDARNEAIYAEYLGHNGQLPANVAVISAANEPNILSDVAKLKPEAIFGKPLDVDDFFDWVRAEGLAPASK